MPWADMNPALFWAIALPLFFLTLAVATAIAERWAKRDDVGYWSAHERRKR